MYQQLYSSSYVGSSIIILDMIWELNYQYKCQPTDLNKFVFSIQYLLWKGISHYG